MSALYGKLGPNPSTLSRAALNQNTALHEIDTLLHAVQADMVERLLILCGLEAPSPVLHLYL